MEHKTHTAGRQHKWKSLTSIFLAKDVRMSIVALQKTIKAMYKSYAEDSIKRNRLKDLALDMWISMQNEFYMTASICDNTIWYWQDEVEKFDEYGYLIERRPVGFTEWTSLLKGWYNRNWAYEVLTFIKDWNLDNQDPEYVKVFQRDFMKVENSEQFCSVLYKWNDLVHWSPWKMSLLDTSFQMPTSVHYEDDFNPDVDSDAYLD